MSGDHTTHVLLIPFDVDLAATTRQWVELTTALTAALPGWVKPMLLPGARGSITLLPYEPPEEA